MNHSKSRNLLLLILCVVVLIATRTSSQQPARDKAPAASAQTQRLEIRSQAGMPFTAEERSQIVSFALQHPRVAALTKGQQVKALAVVSEPDEKQEQEGPPKRRLASVTFFNYTAGKAFRTIVDLSNSEVVNVQPLVGRPPASEEELQSARRLLESNADIKQLLSSGGEVEGGFIVDPPRGSPAKDRFVQFHILTQHREKLERVVTVDLTSDRIAAMTTANK